MNTKVMILSFIALFACCSAGIVPAAYVAPYASSYNAHVVNHAVAAPVAAPLVSAPLVSAPLAAAYPYAAAYSAYPYAAAYSAPVVAYK